MNDNFQSSQYSESLHKKWSFLLWASSVNVTKFAVTSFFLPLFTNDVTLHVTVMLMSTLFILYFLTKISNINVLSKLLNSLQGYIKWSGCLPTIFKRPPLDFSHTHHFSRMITRLHSHEKGSTILLPNKTKITTACSISFFRNVAKSKDG